jgi:hypothetical protein
MSVAGINFVMECVTVTSEEFTCEILCRKI